MQIEAEELSKLLKNASDEGAHRAFMLTRKLAEHTEAAHAQRVQGLELQILDYQDQLKKSVSLELLARVAGHVHNGRTVYAIRELRDIFSSMSLWETKHIVEGTYPAPPPPIEAEDDSEETT